MIFKWLRILFFSTVIILLQVWLFNGVILFKMATPYVYPIILMLLPIQTSRTKSILFSAIVGAILDMLTFIPGIYMATMTILGFLRYYLLLRLVDDETNIEDSAVWSTLGRRSILFLLELIYINTFLLLFFDSFRIFNVYYFFTRLHSSFLVSIFVSVIILYFFDHLNIRKVRNGK